MTRYFSKHDIVNLPSVWDEPLMNSTVRAIKIYQEFDDLGFETSIQNFKWENGDEYISGANTQAILRSPRAEGTESIVIMTPQYCKHGNRNYSLGLY